MQQPASADASFGAKLRTRSLWKLATATTLHKTPALAPDKKQRLKSQPSDRNDCISQLPTVESLESLLATHTAPFLRFVPATDGCQDAFPATAFCPVARIASLLGSSAPFSPASICTAGVVVQRTEERFCNAVFDATSSTKVRSTVLIVEDAAAEAHIRCVVAAKVSQRVALGDFLLLKGVCVHAAAAASRHEDASLPCVTVHAAAQLRVLGAFREDFVKCSFAACSRAALR